MVEKGEISQTEKKKIEKGVEKNLEAKLQKKFDLQLKRELKKSEQLSKVAMKEANKASLEALKKAKSSATTLREEYKKQMLTALAAAFGVLIALAWKDPITNAVNKLIISMGLRHETIGWQFVVAVVITLVCVLGLVVLAQFGKKSE